MLFDRPASLPTATLRSSSHFAAFANQLRGARARGWRWIQPRLVPLTVAIVGMLAVLGSAEYLTHLARYTPAPVAAIAPLTVEHAQPSALGRAAQPATSQPLRVIVLSGQ